MDQLGSYFPQDLVQSWSGSGFRWMHLGKHNHLMLE